MENQEQEVAATPRKMLHIQVSGNASQENLATLVSEFQKTWDNNGIIATQDNVAANIIQSNEELAGMILTPKMAIGEVASIVVDVIRAFDIGQGNEPSPLFVELDQDAQVEVLNRIQCVLRFGALPPSEGGIAEKTRDAIFVATARALGVKLTVPSLDKMINVVKIAQKVGAEDFEVNFSEIGAGDIFKHQDKTFVAESNPYVNWIAQPFPVVTLDAKVYQKPEPVAPEDIKKSAPVEKKVQSKPSKPQTKTRKK
jgi:hypothetical protein